MALNDFRSAVVAGRARKPVAKPEPRAVPTMHMKSRVGDYVQYADDASDPFVDKDPLWFSLLAVAVWIAFLIYAA